MPELHISEISIELPDGRVAHLPTAVLEQYLDDQDDVTAHSMAVDQHTGISDYHVDWELGDCWASDPFTGELREYFQVWHRHPFGTDYAELFEG